MKDRAQLYVFVVIPTPSIRITLSLRVSAALSVKGLLLVRYIISGIAGTCCVKYRRLVAFTVYLKTTIAHFGVINPIYMRVMSGDVMAGVWGCGRA